MKRNWSKFHRTLVIAFGLALCGLFASSGTVARGQALTWNGGGGTLAPSDSSGAWDYATPAWWNGSPGATWTDGSDAVFGAGAGNGTAGTVTIGSGITLLPNSITFAPTGNGGAYTITGGSIYTNYNASGSLPITVNNNAAIATPLGGAGGLTVSGSGLLSLSAYNTYSGPTIVSGGTLQIVSPAAGAAAHYTFDGNVNDATGNGHNGTFVGTPTFTTGQFGQAITFDGATQGVMVPYSSTLPTSAYTVSFWENVSSFTNVGNPTLFSTRNGGDNTFDIQLTSSGGLHADYGNANGSWINTSANSVGSPITLNTWNMVTYTVSSAGASIYVNGVLNNSFGAAGTPGFMRTSSIMTIGEQGGGTYLQGSMDELSIYNSVLSQAQVTNLYKGQLGQLPSATPAVVGSGAAFDLHGTSQTLASLSDLSGAGGTITSSIAGPAPLTLNPTGSTTYSGVIQNGSGTVSLTLNGAGTQVLAGSNTYSGVTTISAGTLQIGNGGNTGTLGSASVVNNSTLVFSRSDASLTISNAISGSGAVNFNTAGVTTLTGNSGVSGQATFSAGTLQVGNGTSGKDGYLGAANIVNNTTLAYNTAVSQVYTGVISGSGAVSKTGTGTLVLSGTNTYTGATNINGGTVRLAPIATVTPGSSLYLNAASVGGIANGGTLAAVQDLSGNGNNTTAGAGTVTYSSTGLSGNPALVFNGTSYLNDPYSASGSTGTIFVVEKAANLTQTGAYFGSSANGANIEFRQFSTGGVAQLNLLRQNTTSLNNTTTAGGAVTGSSQVVAVTFNQSGGGSINYYVNGAAQPVSGQNTTAFGGGATACIGGASNGDDFNGNISAVVAYTSVLTPAQIAATSTALSNQFFGTPANYAVLPATTDLSINASGAGLDLYGMNQSVASLSGVAGSFVYLGGGALTVGSDGLTTTFSGNINNSGGAGLGTGGSLTKIGSGMLTLAGLNAYSGATTVSSGTLAIGPSGGLSSATSLTANGTVIFNNASQTLASLTDSGAGSGLITLNNTLLTVGGTSSFSGGISGGGSLITTGSMTLTGVSGYTGATTISGAMVLASATSNNIPASSPVTVNPASTLNVSGLGGGSGITLSGGQTLRGSGTVLGSVTALSGATVLAGTGNATGTGIGTLTISNGLNLASGATVTDYLGAPGPLSTSPGTAGLINVQGTLTLPSSGLNLSLLNNSNAGNLGNAGNGWYELFSYGSLSGNPSAAFPASIGAKLFTYVSGSGQIDVDVQILALNWTGTASSSWDTVGSTNWANTSTSTAASYLDGANVTFSDTNPLTGGTISNSNVVIQPAGVQPNSVTFNNNAVTYTVSDSSGTAGIAGTTGIVLSGSGTVNLQSANSFQGLVAVNGGILNISNSASLGTSSGVSVASGAALQMQGGIAVGAIPLSLNGGGFSANPAGALDSVNGVNSYAGAVTLNGPSTITAAAGQLTLSGGINNSGNVLTIGGAGTVNAANLSGTGGLTVNSGASLNLSGTMSSASSLIVNGALALSTPSQTVAALNDSGLGSGSVTLNNTALTLTGTSAYTGSISGGGSLTLVGGALTLSGNTALPAVNVNSATLSVTGGAVVAQTTFSVTTGTNSINLSGGVLQTPAWTGGLNTTLNFSGGTLQANASSIYFLGATPSANVNVNAGSAVIDTQANNVAITQSLAGAGGLTKLGTGQLTLGATNSYNGPTVVNAGVLQLGAGPTVIAGGVARYTFDGNALDVTGNGNNATLVGGPTFTTGKFAGALSLNGTNQYVTVPYSSSLTGLNAYTFSEWVDFTAPTPVSGSGPVLVSTRNGGDTTFDLQYAQPSAGSYYFHSDIGTGSAWLNTAANSSTFGALSGWNMVTETVSSSGFAIYLNGSQIGSGATGSTPLFIKAGQTMSIGAQEAGGSSYNSSSGYMTGAVDETNLFGSVLSSAQVLSLYQSQAAQLPATTPLTVNSGATFDLNGASQQVASLSDGSGGGGLVTNSAAGSNATLTLNPTNSTNTFSGTIANAAGTVSFALAGDTNSTQVLSGVNTFSGSAYVGNSTLVLANSGALLNATVSAAFGGGGIIFDQSVASHTFAFGGLTGSFMLEISDDNGNPVFLTVGSNNQNTTFNGTIDDAGAGGSLTKTGSGTLTLSGGPNTYSGGTFINGGELSLNNPGAIPAGGAITFGGGALQFTLNNTTDFSTQIVNSTGPIALDTNGLLIALNGGLDASNTAGLAKLGSGTLALNGANSFGGPLYIIGGDVNINSAAALPNGDNITFGGGVLQYTSSNTGDYSNVIKNSFGPIAVDTNGLNISFAGVLDASNSGGLTKLGLGTLTLAASNAYSGTTTVAAGVLQLANQAGVPVNGALAVSGGTFDLNGYSPSLSVVSASALSGGLVTSSSAAAVTLNLSVGSGTAGFESVVGTTLSDGSGTLALTVSSTNGSGLQITSTNTFSGGTTINDSYVRLGNASALGTGTITISNSGFVELWWNTGSGTGTIGNNFVLNTPGGAQFGSQPPKQKTAIFSDGNGGGNGTNVLSGSITLGANGGGIDGYPTNNIIVNGPISGPGALYKGIVNEGNGGDTVTLTNTANSYQGGTYINDGTLAITADAVLGSGNVTFGGNSTLQAGISGGTAATSIVLSPARQITISTTGAATINVQNNSMTIPGAISGTGGLITTGGAAGLLILSGNNTYGGATYVNGGTLNLASATAIPSGGNITFGGGVLQYSPANAVDYSGQIVNSGSPIAIDTNGQNVTLASSLAASNIGGLSKYGAGTLTLSASNALSGTTAINGGTLSLKNASALPPSGNITFGGGTLQYTASNTVDYSSRIVNSTAPISIDTNGQNVAFNGTLPSSNTNGLTKIGAGTLVIGYLNAYGGPTLIQGGTLMLTATGFTAPSGAVAHYTFDGTTNDSSGNNNNGTPLGAPTYVAGATSALGQAINFNGTSQYVSVPNSASLSNLSAWTVSAWVNLSSTPNANNGILGTRFGGDETYDIKYSTPSSIHSDIGSSNAWLTTNGDATATLNSGTWYLLTETVNHSGYNIYLNGGLVGSGAYLGTPLFMTAAQTLGIGQDYPGEYFSGSMDDVYVYGSALSAANVTSLYNSYFPSNLLPTSTPVTVAAGSKFDLNGVNQQIGSLSGAGAVTTSSTASAATLTVGGPSNQSSSFTGTISDAGAAPLSLATGGTGTFTLAGTASIQGTVNVPVGTLAVNGALSTEALNITLSPSSTGQGSGELAGSGTITLGSTMFYNSTATSMFAGVLQGSAPTAGLEVDGGTLILSGTNTLAGGTVVTNGTLILDSPAALADGSSLTVGQGAAAIFAPAAGAVAAVPEPSTLWLLAAGLCSAAMSWRVRRKPGPGRQGA